MEGPIGARVVVGMKRLEDFILRRPDPKKRTCFSGNDPTAQQSRRPSTRQGVHAIEMLRVRKTVQNRRIDLLATALDRQNQRKWHISGEVSPRQRCHYSSTPVSPQKDVGTVTAEYTGYKHKGHHASPDSLCQLRPRNPTEPAKP